MTQPGSMENKKIGTDNPGWKYIKLPQSIYLTDPEARRYYFGYADPRFRYFDQGMPFREIVTYSFLGCGEFYKLDKLNVWANGKFHIPGSILDMLMDLKPDERAENMVIWKNIHTRNPELVEQVSELKSIRSFTRDGLYLYANSVSPGLLKKLNDTQGLTFFNGPLDKKLPQFETLLEETGIPETRVLKKLLLENIIHGGKFNFSPIGWAKVIHDLYGLDNTCTALTKHQNLLRCYSNLMFDGESYILKPEAMKNLIKFFRGVSFKQFIEILNGTKGAAPGTAEVQDVHVSVRDTLSLIIGKLEVLEQHFSLDGETKERPNLWKFMRKHRVPFNYVSVMFREAKDIHSLFKTIESEIPVLYEDKDFQVRSPVNGLEVMFWGYELSNCLKNYNYSGTKNYWVFGIFERGKLIGATQVGRDLRIEQFSGFSNTQIPGEKNTFLRKKVNQALLDFDPREQFKKELGIKLAKKLVGKKISESTLFDIRKEITDYLTGRINKLEKMGMLSQAYTVDRAVNDLSKDLPELQEFLSSYSLKERRILSLDESDSALQRVLGDVPR